MAIMTGIRLGASLAHAEAPPRLDVYRSDDTHAACGYTNPQTGVTTPYEAPTSQRLGQFRQLSEPNATRPNGQRMPEGALGVIPPQGAK